MIIGNVTVNLLVYVSMVKTVVDAISQNRSFKEVAVYVMVIGAVQILMDLLNNSFNHYINTMAKLKIHKSIHSIIFQKVQEVDLENYDNTEFYNDYIWALEKADTQIINSYENLCQFVEAFGNAAALFSVTLFYDKFLLLFVVAPLVLNVALGSYISRLDYEYEKKVNIIQRRKDYFRRVFYLKDYAKELKLYSIGRVLLKNFRNSVDRQMDTYKKYSFRFMWTGTLNDSLTSVFDYMLLCLYMAYQAIVKKAYTAGTCAAMLNAVGNMSYALERLFGLIPKIRKNGMYAEKILGIINYEGEIESFAADNAVVPDFKNLTLNNLSFSYSENEKITLKNISLSLARGEKIALVGMNGAGKTTLIKLIMRYYDPAEGSITYNGTDIREFTTKEFRSHFSVIFQDFQMYAVSLEENIKMDLAEEQDCSLIQKALEQSSLPDYQGQLSAQVTREFDEQGIVFSGGQSQKAAIARALYRNGDIVIMDEASSALDPISEAQINQMIMEQMKEKSMIIISHRLSTIKHVDTIYFMEQGQIVEQGSHEELMKYNGKYAEMYTIQAEQYLMEESNNIVS